MKHMLVLISTGILSVLYHYLINRHFAFTLNDHALAKILRG